MKRIQKSLLASGASLLVSVALLVGSTFAWFTDSVTNTGNTIEAGTLEVTFEKLDKETNSYNTVENNDPIFNYTLWEPGYSVSEAFKVGNEGSLALKYELKLTADGQLTKLADVIDVYYMASNTEIKVEDLADNMSDLTEYTRIGTLSEVLGEDNIAATGHIEAEEADYAAVILHMQEGASNDYQSLSLFEGTGTFDITLKATQYTSEQDGFGNDQYDAAADADAAFGKEIVDKLNDPNVSVVVAGSDIDMNDSVFDDKNGNDTFVIPDGKTLDLNGNKFIRPGKGSGNGLSVKEGTTATVKNGTLYNESDLTLVDVEYGSSLTFENVDFIGHGDDAIKVRANGESTAVTLIFKNCTFTNAGVKFSGMNSASEINVQFENCTFTGTYKMYDENGEALTDPYGHIHYTTCLINSESNYLYGNISVKDCNFNLDCQEASYKQEIISLYGCYQKNYPGKMLNVTLENVSMTGNKVTPVKIDSRYDDGLNFTEKNTSYVIDGANVNYDGTKK